MPKKEKQYNILYRLFPLFLETEFALLDLCLLDLIRLMLMSAKNLRLL